MIFLDLENKLNNFFTYEKVSDMEIKIKCDAKFLNGKNVDIRIIESMNKFYLTDNKSTLKYMNEIYELKSVDVKSCIQAVLKIYNFSMSAGEIRVEIKSADNINTLISNMIMCVGQLANMYAFFEKPE